MKRNLALLLATILTISPVYVGMEASADTNIETAAVIEDAPTEESVETEGEPVDETVGEPAAEGVVPEAEAALPEAAPEITYSFVSADHNNDFDSELQKAVEEELPLEILVGDSFSLSVLQKTAAAPQEAEETAAEASETVVTDILWECSDPEVLSLDENGTVTALKAGQASIYATVTSEEDSFTLTLNINVAEIAEENPVEETAASENVTDETASLETGTEETASLETGTEEIASAEIAAEETLSAEIAAETQTQEALAAPEDSTALAEVEMLLSESGTISAGAAAEGALKNITGNWKKTNGEWYFIKDDGTKAVGLQLIGGIRYFFHTNGAMQTGWIKDNNDWYYFERSGAMKTGWLYYKNKWYYLDPDKDGVMAAGSFITYNNSKYYLDDSGAMKTGWATIDKDWYYFDRSGALQTGWVQFNKTWYYLDPSKDGAMAADTFITYKNNKYYLDGSGAMRTGWAKIKGVWYFFSGSGAQLSDWVYTDNNWYYLDPANNGAMVSNSIFAIKGKYYGFTKSGEMLGTGWHKIDNTYYYAGPSGNFLTGSQEINSSWYYLDPNNKGAMITGPFEINGKTYLYANSGKLTKNGWTYYNDNWYHGDSEGKMQTGWIKLGSKWFYLKNDGKMATGWVFWKDRWCYMDSNGVMLANTFVTVGGKRYYLGSDGYMYSNKWFSVGGKWYYAGGSGALKTGTAEIDGKTYEFNSDGSWIVSTASYSNRQEFIALMAQLVRKYAPQWGVKVYSPIIAQAILESAYGESSLGKKYNNFFGLKCGTLWTGKSVSLKTGEEYSPGTYTTITANFRVYDSIEEGVRGYFVFLFEGRTRYNNLIGVTDPQTYLQRIKDDGYATSSKYVQNCMNVVRQYNLTQYDD